mmetsp:Transcript_24707/g.53499  ORF Transcript_24707/g.53499 Transcript_24707/m.53499 type:complete len:200 (-) Transcript_24707:180-779(-)
MVQLAQEGPSRSMPSSLSTGGGSASMQPRTTPTTSATKTKMKMVEGLKKTRRRDENKTSKELSCEERKQKQNRPTFADMPATKCLNEEGPCQWKVADKDGTESSGETHVPMVPSTRFATSRSETETQHAIELEAGKNAAMSNLQVVEADCSSEKWLHGVTCPSGEQFYDSVRGLQSGLQPKGNFFESPLDKEGFIKCLL